MKLIFLTRSFTAIKTYVVPWWLHVMCVTKLYLKNVFKLKYFINSCTEFGEKKNAINCFWPTACCYIRLPEAVHVWPYRQHQNSLLKTVGRRYFIHILEEYFKHIFYRRNTVARAGRKKLRLVRQIKNLKLEHHITIGSPRLG